MPITVLSKNNNYQDNSLKSLIDKPDSFIKLFEKKLSSDSIILIFDLQNIIVLDTKRDRTSVDDNQQNKMEYFAFYSNKEVSVYKYLAIFEKIWILEKITNCDIK